MNYEDKRFYKFWSIHQGCGGAAVAGCRGGAAVPGGRGGAAMVGGHGGAVASMRCGEASAGMRAGVSLLPSYALWPLSPITHPSGAGPPG